MFSLLVLLLGTIVDRVIFGKLQDSDGMCDFGLDNGLFCCWHWVLVV
ncbi:MULTISPECIES: hypothetical protein [unclassified Microcoleus]|nr:MULTISPECIES: hypothetical protein [unclassified Microcoleus]